MQVWVVCGKLKSVEEAFGCRIQDLSLARAHGAQPCQHALARHHWPASRKADDNAHYLPCWSFGGRLAEAVVTRP
jgi:hypothetical protein